MAETIADHEKPGITLNNSESGLPPDDHAQNTSDSEGTHQLEVICETEQGSERQNNLRKIASRPKASKRRTSCIVHGFLKDDKLGAMEAPHDDDYFKQAQDVKEMPEANGNGESKSRTLTKKELSDMAFSIRELSKRLGKFKLRLNVRNVFLLTKAHDESLIQYTRAVTEWLLSTESGGPYNVWVEDTLRDKKQFDTAGIQAKYESANTQLKFWTTELCRKSPQKFDIVLALGGDGTVLYASWLFQRIVPPVIAFAMGSLGFLTKFDYDEYKTTLHQVFDEGLTVSLRLRLEATVMRSNRTRKGDEKLDLVEDLTGKEVNDYATHTAEGVYEILNDVVLDRGPSPTMSSIEVFGDNHHLTSVQADGVCIATPTGSTAYNLAAGGSLCHPDNPVILLTAICAHTLSFRPIVLPDTVTLRLGVPYDARNHPWCSFDGKERVELRPGDFVTVSASRFPFPTVLPLGKGSEDWVESLSGTLQWNNRKRQKAFKD